ncbi:MAG TPA: carboxypeptidase-like regulatory domain-containing protein [Bryobacteraceae bacterium]|nr:carboxypeptidase-like regulatory domain-containing protein [Bryobacteraceae bacterium]
MTKILASMLLVCPGFLWAQSTAQISGTVKDQTGAVIAEAQVTATNTATGLKRSATTDASGAYTLANLPVGPYRLDASAAGFRTYVQTGIVLQVADNPVINPALDVGQVSDQIQVEAAAPQVETRDTGISQVMDSTRVVELPLNGRQVTDLIVLSGAATVSSTTSFVRNYPSVNISVAGGMHNGLTYLLDGASHNDPINGLNLPLPFPDALLEFKLETSSLSAQYGQHSAGAVNAVTKSGTNSFHGDLFEFFRNGDLNARNFFAVVPDQLKRNQFGGTIGGPIRKDKLFFFGSYQGTRLIGTVTPQFAYLPTQNMLNGDWTAIASRACNGNRQLTLKPPFANNQISPSLFSPVSMAIMASGKLPIATDPCGKVEFGIKPVTNEDLTIDKVDYQINEKHSFFGRYELAHLVDPSGYVPGNLLTTGSANDGPYTTYPVVNLWQTQSFALGDTYLISPNLVSSFRAAALRPTNSRGQPPAEITPQSVGITPYYEPTNNAILGLSVSGGFSIGGQGGNVPGLTNATAFQESEDLSWVKGAHQFGFGVNHIHARLNVSGWTSSDGVFSFNSTNTGLGLGDFMLGDVNTFTQQGVQHIGFTSEYVGMYAQDTWKMSSRLTMNLGIRWDPYLPFSWTDGQSFYFTQAAFNAGLHSTVYPNAPAGVLYSGDPGVPAGGKTNPNQWGHFSPRAGFAFDPTGSGRMTIRAAYGLFRDYPDFYESEYVKTSPPFNDTIVITAPGGGTPAGFANPWLGYPGGSPFPNTLSRNVSFPTNAGWVVIPPNLPAVYVNQWNLSIQRQIGTNWLISANYIGSEATHLLSSIEGDPAVYLPGASCVINGVSYSPCSSVSNTTQRRQLYLQNPSQGKYYGSIVTENATGTMSYNGLFLTAQRRISGGLTMQVNYTFSHCINTGTQQLISIPIIAGISPVASRAGLRGNCSLLEEDRRHNFNMSTVYIIPQFANRTARIVGSGWQVSGIVRVLSGDYFSLAAGLDQALSGTDDQRPQQVLPNVYCANRSVSCWLNPAAFAQPALGTYGNMGPGTVEGPGFFGIDMNVTRRFQIRESHSVEARGEAFNLLNHVNPLDPVTTLTSSTFGQIQAASDPRILQLAVKYVF